VVSCFEADKSGLLYQMGHFAARTSYSKENLNC